MEIFTAEGFSALLAVIGIDLVLAGDNAIVIGLAAAGLAKEQRARAILIGIIAATVMRIGFAMLTTQLLQIVGLLLAGGILLLWVCWKMWRELHHTQADDQRAEEALAGEDLNDDGEIAAGAPRKTFAQAAMQIVVADVSMSLDNGTGTARINGDVVATLAGSPGLGTDFGWAQYVNGAYISAAYDNFLVIAAPNDAPVNAVPSPQSTDEDVALVFSTATDNPIHTPGAPIFAWKPSQYATGNPKHQ